MTDKSELVKVDLDEVDKLVKRIAEESTGGCNKLIIDIANGSTDLVKQYAKPSAESIYAVAQLAMTTGFAAAYQVLMRHSGNDVPMKECHEVCVKALSEMAEEVVELYQEEPKEEELLFDKPEKVH